MHIFCDLSNLQSVCSEHSITDDDDEDESTRSQPAQSFTADSLQLSSELSDWLSREILRNGNAIKPEADH